MFYYTGYQLYQTAKRYNSRVEMVAYPPKLELGHNNIWTEKNYPDKVRELVAKIRPRYD